MFIAPMSYLLNYQYRTRYFRGWFFLMSVHPCFQTSSGQYFYNNVNDINRINEDDYVVVQCDNNEVGSPC